jgi:hypothetical protein
VLSLIRHIASLWRHLFFSVAVLVGDHRFGILDLEEIRMTPFIDRNFDFFDNSQLLTQ